MLDLADDEDADDAPPPLIDWAGIQATPAAEGRAARRDRARRMLERTRRFERARRIRAGWDEESFLIEEMLIADEIARILVDRRNSSETESA